MAENLIKEHMETAIPSSPIIKCLASLPGGAEVHVRQNHDSRLADDEGHGGDYYPDVIKAGSVVVVDGDEPYYKWTTLAYDADVGDHAINVRDTYIVGVVKNDAKVYKVDNDDYRATCDIMLAGVVDAVALDLSNADFTSLTDIGNSSILWYYLG